MRHETFPVEGHRHVAVGHRAARGARPAVRERRPPHAEQRLFALDPLAGAVRTHYAGCPAPSQALAVEHHR
ncbi:hypothetical protein [Streptomyces sp. B6B3]|uniref:hypothetical protein n=1 Tax=Streptomyces sp. B6B3 TaxID=3153570 RepID=UPI00325CBA67